MTELTSILAGLCLTAACFVYGFAWHHFVWTGTADTGTAFVTGTWTVAVAMCAASYIN